MSGSIRVFTRTDLERACRLAVLRYVAEPNPELAVMAAVRSVAADSPPYYGEPEVRDLLGVVTGKHGAELDKAFEEALLVLERL